MVCLGKIIKKKIKGRALKMLNWKFVKKMMKRFGIDLTEFIPKKTYEYLKSLPDCQDAFYQIFHKYEQLINSKSSVKKEEVKDFLKAAHLI